MLDDSSEFLDAIAGQYSELEKRLGADGFEVWCAIGQSQALLQKNRAGLVTAWVAVLNVLLLFGALGMIPLLVWLWRWALP